MVKLHQELFNSLFLAVQDTYVNYWVGGTNSEKKSNQNQLHYPADGVNQFELLWPALVASTFINSLGNRLQELWPWLKTLATY